MKRTSGKIVKWVTILVVIGGLGYGGYTLYLKYYGSDAASSSGASYTPVSVTTGDLNQEVISTGSLSIADTAEIKAPADITIEKLLVKAGQTVQAGDALASVDLTTLDTAIAALKTEIETLDSTLVSLAGSYSDTESITNPVSGRVKVIYGKAGDSVQDIVDENGALYILSLDGKMRVNVPTNGFLKVNDSVTVIYGERKWTGTVVKLSGSEATVTFTDTAVLPGESVTVQSNGVLLGSSSCEINMPLSVSSSVRGYISSASLKINTLYGKRASMFSVTNVELTQEYQDSVDSRAELLRELAQLQALKKDPTLYSEQAGIVSTLNVSSGAAVVKDDSLVTMYVGSPSEMIISVDELDIINVKAGQSATVAMDALTDKTYDATVEYVSEIGTVSSGITNYQVTVRVNADSDLKLGMNGTVTINLGKTENALLVPLTALQSDSKGSYVWLYQEGYIGTDEAPGIKTYITTGLSNESYAAVLSGLNAGDQVLVVRSAAGAGSSGQTDQMAMTAMPQGMSMPDGMGAPSGAGSGQRPNNNSNNGGTRSNGASAQGGYQ